MTKKMIAARAAKKLSNKLHAVALKAWATRRKTTNVARSARKSWATRRAA